MEDKPNETSEAGRVVWLKYKFPDIKLVEIADIRLNEQGFKETYYTFPYFDGIEEYMKEYTDNWEPFIEEIRKVNKLSRNVLKNL